MKKIIKPFKEFLKKIIFRYTFFGRPNYPYNVEPIQLVTFINELERLINVSGNIVEIGVARGMTTRFICEHIRTQKLNNSLTFFAIDTFNSFNIEDLNFEIKERGKSLLDLKGFDYNDYEVWKKNFKEFSFLKAIKADCSTLNYSELGPIKLSFLDVDLYLPTKNALFKLYDATVSGGVILIDDVLNNNTYDGSYQAYIEFCLSKNIDPKIIGNRCGIIYKY
jgi:hypothetical protein